MKKDAIKSYLKDLGAKVPTAQPRTGWILSSCPLGPWRHESGESAPTVFGVKVEDGDGRVNCFACGYHGSQMDLIIEVRRLAKQTGHEVPNLKGALEKVIAAEDETDAGDFNSPDIEEVLFGQHKQAMKEFPDAWYWTFPEVSTVKFAVDYLKARDVPLSVAKMLDLRADTKQRRICFPVRDFHGRGRGLHGRAVDPDTDPRYRMYTLHKQNNPLVWLGESWVDLSKPVVCVEGPFDLTSVMRVYRNVVSPLFASPSFEKIKRMADAFEVITLFDKGTGGNLGRERFNKALPNSVMTHLLPTGDNKDPGEMTVPELAELLGKHVPLDDFLLD